MLKNGSLRSHLHYDNAGNIIEKKKYAYGAETLGTTTDAISYGLVWIVGYSGPNGRQRHARGRIYIRCMGQVDLNQRHPGKHVGSRQSLPLQGLLLRRRNRAVLPYDAVLRSGGGAVPFGGCISFHWAGCAGRQYVGVLP